MITYTFTLAVQGELTVFNPQPQERLEELSRAIRQLVQDRFRNVNLETPIAIHLKGFSHENTSDSRRY